MIVTKKMLLASGGLVGLAVVGLGIVRTFYGHWDPITVDNPRVGVNFNFFGHRVKVNRGSDLLVTTIQRDITALIGVIAVSRDGKSHPVDFKPGAPIEVELYNNQTSLTISTFDARPYNQILVNVNGLFGKCMISSILFNSCGAADSSLRMHAVRYVDQQNNQRHYCLNSWEDLNGGTVKCLAPDLQTEAHLQLNMSKQ